MAEEQETVVKQIDPREEKRQERERRAQEAAGKEKQLKADYLAVAKTPAFIDLQEKLAEFAAYHVRIAKDAVGFENKVTGRDDKGNPVSEQVLVRFTPEQRVSELDKSAGVQEAIDYITRKLTMEPSTSINKKDKTNA